MPNYLRQLKYDCVAVTENCRRVKGTWMCFGGGGYAWCNTGSWNADMLTML